MRAAENYFKELTLARGIAILLAILGNSITTTPVDMKVTGGLLLLHNYIYSFHMHLFFVVSGCCLGLAKQERYIRMVEKKISRLLIPYLLFSLLFFCRYMFFDPYHLMPEIWSYIILILLKGGEYWFIFVLFLFFIIYPVASFPAGKIGSVCNIFLLLLFAYFCRVFFSESLINHDAFYFLVYLAYFLSGYFVAPFVSSWLRNKQRMPPIVFFGAMLLFLLLGRLDLRSHDVPAIIIIFTPFFGIVLAMGMAQFLAHTGFAKFFLWLGKWSLQLYLVEALIAVFVMYFYYDVMSVRHSLPLMLLFFLSKMIICYLLLEFGIGRLLILHKFCGVIRRKEAAM
ncbi:MAG: acyltransferase family protein [Deltaproteobacteria bacterium]|nr:acyltransferase family protein [Deltaproteobacteria bacterium]